jgi:hypothetical protein
MISPKLANEVLPVFPAGVLEEPDLLFGGGHHHIEPKLGISLYGPYSFPDQNEPTLRAIHIGVVSTGPLIAELRQWVSACGRLVTNDGSQPFYLPPFPGMSRTSAWACDLVMSAAWQETISEASLRAALLTADATKRISAVASIFRDGVQNLSERTPRPDVVLCAIPEEIIDGCLVEGVLQRLRPKPTTAEKKRQREIDAGQGVLDLGLDEDEPDDDDDIGHRNLRRAIKAEVMPFGLPTQIMRESTLRGTGKGNRRVQDPATRAWNWCTGVYYKAGGHPWRLADMPPDTCYVGISFYREAPATGPRMQTSLAQLFAHRGDGLVMRGAPFEWRGPANSPHMTQENARDLFQQVLSLYARHSLRPPLRVVVHKSSRFWEEEIAGIRDALGQVPTVDLVAFGKRRIQLVRHGQYPPLRGTWVRFADDDLLLYTKGYVPILRTYPGARVPQPIEVLEHHGVTAPDEVLAEILGLTKLNWNTADFSCEEPMTLAFARRVGEILAELPPGVIPQTDYRFYM